MERIYYLIFFSVYESKADDGHFGRWLAERLSSSFTWLMWPVLPPELLESRTHAHSLFLCRGFSSAKQELCPGGAGGKGTKLGHPASVPADKGRHQCPLFSDQVGPYFQALSPLTQPLENSTGPLQTIWPERRFLSGMGQGFSQEDATLVYLPLLLALRDRMRAVWTGFAVHSSMTCSLVFLTNHRAIQ